MMGKEEVASGRVMRVSRVRCLSCVARGEGRGIGCGMNEGGYHENG